MVVDIDMLIQGIYAASVSPELWPAVLRDICAAVQYNDDGPFISGTTAGDMLQRLASGSLDESESNHFLAIALFKKLRPHFRRGMEITRRLEETDRRAAAADNVVERFPCGVVLLDPDGGVIFRNRVAGTIIEANDGICCDRGGLTVSRRQAAFRKLVAAAVKTGTGASAGGHFVAARPSGRRSYHVVVSPMPSQDPLIARRYPAAAVFISDPETETTPPHETLQQWFGLTRREAALVRMLAQGGTLAESADRLHVRYGTARNYLQSIFRKTGTRRQSDLIRLMGTLPNWGQR